MNIEKVTRMIALSTSPNENEARNAAMLACKAIREAGLVLLAPDDPRLGRFPDMPPWRPNDCAREQRDRAERERAERARQARERIEREEREREERDRKEAFRRAREAAGAPPPPPKADRFNRAQRKPITAQFDSVCKACRRAIGAGTTAWWMSGGGCLCETCQEAP